MKVYAYSIFPKPTLKNLSPLVQTAQNDDHIDFTSTAATVCIKKVATFLREFFFGDH